MELTRKSLRACFREDNMFSKEGWFVHTLYYRKKHGFLTLQGHVTKGKVEEFINNFFDFDLVIYKLAFLKKVEEINFESLIQEPIEIEKLEKEEKIKGLERENMRLRNRLDRLEGGRDNETN